MTESSSSSFGEYVFVLLGAFGIMIIKFFSWIMPEAYKLFIDGIKFRLIDLWKAENKTLFDEVHKLSSQVEELSSSLKTYKTQKHTLEGELLEIKDAIINDDKEKFEEIKKIYKNEKNH